MYCSMPPGWTPAEYTFSISMVVSGRRWLVPVVPVNGPDISRTTGTGGWCVGPLTSGAFCTQMCPVLDASGGTNSVQLRAGVCHPPGQSSLPSIGGRVRWVEREGMMYSRIPVLLLLLLLPFPMETSLKRGWSDVCSQAFPLPSPRRVRGTWRFLSRVWWMLLTSFETKAFSWCASTPAQPLLLCSADRVIKWLWWSLTWGTCQSSVSGEGT